MQSNAMVLLADRGVVRVAGADAESFLDNLVTNDVTGMSPGVARFAALLTPQGKVLVDFLVVRTADGFLLDVARDKAADLVKRLALYKLRAKVEIADLSGAARVWSDVAQSQAGLVVFADPRHEGLGTRAIEVREATAATSKLAPPSSSDAQTALAAQRIALGVPEGGKDFALGDAFPHEANMDRLNGVSFTKGCFVGQEVVARMQHKTVVRKRVVRIDAKSALTSGTEVKAGDAVIGTLGSVAGTTGLALLRLDRAIEALDKGEAIMAGSQPVTVDAAMLEWYRAEAARKAEEKANRI